MVDEARTVLLSPDHIRRCLDGYCASDLDSPEILRRAAVAAILREGLAGLEVLLIRRAEREGDRWSGHMGFPGGRADPTDRDLLDTVEREVREEVGLDLSRSAVLLGRLDELQAMSRGGPTELAIRPFVFALSEDAPLVPNDEVAEVVWAPLAPLYTGEAQTTYDYPFGEQTLALPAFSVGSHTVWGLTYRMLAAFFELLRAR